MDGIIKVSPEELISTASEFSNTGNSIGSLTSEMVSTVTSLSAVWEGEASMAYNTKFKGLEDDIQMVIRMVQEHAGDLQEMARIYQDAENASLDDISSLSADVIV